MRNHERNLPARVVDRWELPNGLRVVGERLPYLRSVSVGVWLRVGSLLETPEENGLSHFLEHMVFKGTSRYTARGISEAMDAAGGQLDAFTSRDHTCFYAKVIDEDLPLAMDILSDLTMGALIETDELERERGVVLEEIAMDEDSPEDVAMELLSAAQFGDAAPARPILGPAENVRAYTREDLIRYRGRHYTPRSAVLSLAGNYDPAEVLALAEKYFGPWESREPAARMAPYTAADGVLRVREKDVEQLQICLGWPGMPAGDDSLYARGIFSGVFGGSMSSRLFQRVREELGMAYAIYSYGQSYESYGMTGVYAGVSPKNGRLVLDEIRRVAEELLRGGVTPQEFESGKNQMRNSFLMSLESPGSRMQSLGRGTLIGHYRDPETVTARIEAVTLDEVNEAVRRVLSHEPCIAVVGRGAGGFTL